LNADGKNFILVFFTTRRNKRPNLPRPAAPLFRPEFFSPKKKIERRRQKFYSCFFSHPDATKD